MDSIIFQQINNFAGKSLWLDTIGIYLAGHFEHVLWFFLFLFLLKNFKKYWPMVFQALLAAVLARFVIIEIIRYFIPRSRPFIEFSTTPLLEHSLSNSFPSGHAAFYFAIAMVVFLFLKKVYPRPKFWWGAGILFFIASSLIAISRVFVGIHWPSDILAGAVVGVLCGWLIILFSRRFFSGASKQLPQS